MVDFLGVVIGVERVKDFLARRATERVDSDVMFMR
jgi:hypothetical protein